MSRTVKKRYPDPHSVIYYGREEAVRRCQEGIDKWFYEVEEKIPEFHDSLSTSFQGVWTTDVYGNPYVIEDDPRNIEFREYCRKHLWKNNSSEETKNE